MSYKIVVPVQNANGPLNGVTVDAYAVSRFPNDNVPLEDSAAPDSNPPDATAVTATDGAPGQAILSVANQGAYNVRVTYSGHHYWTQSVAAVPGPQGTQGNQGYQGARGYQGTQGYQGYQGNQGYQGVGTIAGGTQGQVLSKNSGTDYDTTWSGPMLPLAGGTMSGALAMGSNKITGLANGSASSDAAAFGQIPTALPPNGSAGGDLTDTYPSPALKTVGTAGTYTKVTTDAKGRVTSGTTLSATDVPTVAAGATGALSATDASVTNARTPSTHASTHGQGGADALTTIPSAVTGTTQTANDNSIKIATTAYADRAATNVQYVRSVNLISTATTAGSSANTDYIYFVSKTTTVTMPTAIGNTNKYTIKNVSTLTNVTVNFFTGPPVESADGSTTLLIRPFQSLDLISNNANWNII